jgi:hypothetical protein
MPICRMKRLRVALFGTLLSFAFTTGTSADPRVDAIVEQVLAPLNAAMGVLTNPGELNSDERHRAVDAIQAAINMLNDYRHQSY